jgi:anti-anti-sigma factor
MRRLVPRERLAMTGFQVSSSPGVLRLAGQIDLAAALDVLDAGLIALAASTDTFVVDLDSVTFIDLTALGVLVRLRNAALAHRLALRLANVPPPVNHVLDLAGLSKVFDERRVFEVRRVHASPDAG